MRGEIITIHTLSHGEAFTFFLDPEYSFVLQIHELGLEEYIGEFLAGNIATEHQGPDHQYKYFWVIQYDESIKYILIYIYLYYT